jgi:hypothetical protein
MQPRVAVHYRLVVRHAGFEGRGHTENLSERGAMISVDVDPPLSPGDPIEVELELPQIGPITFPATVRWTSAVLPGMTGVEFDLPMLPALLAHLAMLIAQRSGDALEVPDPVVVEVASEGGPGGLGPLE